MLLVAATLAVAAPAALAGRPARVEGAGARSRSRTRTRVLSRGRERTRVRRLGESRLRAGRPAARERRALRRFRLTEGQNQNAFYQSDRVTAHALVRRGESPRIVVATPAGNAGVGLWFERVPGAGEKGGLDLVSRVTEVEHRGVAGVSFAVSGPSHLELRRVLLDSVRALRDENAGATAGREALVHQALDELEHAPDRPGVDVLRGRLHQWLSPTIKRAPGRSGAVVVERTSVAGTHYRLELRPADGTSIDQHGDHLSVKSRAPGQRTRFRVHVYIDEPPLEPLSHVLAGGTDAKDARETRRGPRETLRRANQTRRGARETRQERNLGFLGYREKLLAGSWQYLTYFGRDTLVTATLLGDHAAPGTLATAVGSVLDRIGPTGRVAHEEAIGDQAVLERVVDFSRKVARGTARPTEHALAALDRPRYEYTMVDGEYLLPQLVDRLAAQPDHGAHVLGGARIDALARVAVRIADQTADFARRPGAGALVELDPGRDAGNWRDSGTGLGGGRAPLDVNAYLVPSALDALGRLLERPGFPRRQFLDRVARLDPRAARLFRSRSALQKRARVWRRAGERFRVTLEGDTARARLRTYLDRLPAAEREALGRQKLWSGVTVADAVYRGARAPELDQVDFQAVALDEHGAPIPVVASDQALALFDGQPSREQVTDTVTRLFQPYPVGLATPVGLVAANPGFSDRPGDADTFSRQKYHGAVIWGWQQTMVRAGLERQRTRFAGDAGMVKLLDRALGQMNQAERATARFGASELITWKAQGGHIEAAAFGASATDSDEANAVQLWSNAR